MGSDSDLDVMSEAAKILDSFEIANEVRIISAHRTPDVMAKYASDAKKRGLKVIIAGAGGSAHLPGMTASHTPIPVIAVPIRRENQGHEAFWSNIKMPPGIPLATMPENSAKNAALLAVEILAISNSMISDKYDEFRRNQHDGVVKTDLEVQKGWSQILKD